MLLEIGWFVFGVDGLLWASAERGMVSHSLPIDWFVLEANGLRWESKGLFWESMFRFVSRMFFGSRGVRFRRRVRPRHGG